MPKLFRVVNLLATFVAFSMFMAMWQDSIRSLNKAHLDQAAIRMSQVFSDPAVALTTLAPLLYAFAVYHLIDFSASARGGVGGTFSDSSMFTLRLAGVGISLGVLAEVFVPVLALLIHVMPYITSQSASHLYMLGFIGGTLLTLSKNGSLLFRHTRKLRGDLDEIV